VKSAVLGSNKSYIFYRCFHTPSHHLHLSTNGQRKPLFPQHPTLWQNVPYDGLGFFLVSPYSLSPFHLIHFPSPWFIYYGNWWDSDERLSRLTGCYVALSTIRFMESGLYIGILSRSVIDVDLKGVGWPHVSLNDSAFITVCQQSTRWFNAQIWYSLPLGGKIHMWLPRYYLNWYILLMSLSYFSNSA
jgi:hypothetical protein